MKTRLILILVLPWIFVSALNAQEAKDIVSLWVGEVWTMTAEEEGHGTATNIVWRTDNSLLQIIPNKFTCKIKAKQYFSGMASVTVTYDYINDTGFPREYSLTCFFSCIDNAVTITPQSMTLQVNGWGQLSYYHSNEAYASFATVTFSCSSDAVSVSNSGKVTANRAGTAKVYVHSTLANDENAPYCTVTVEGSSTTPTITLPKNMTLNVGESQMIVPTHSPGPAYTLIWTSTNNSVATVSSSGMVTARKKGSARIYATISGYGVSDYCDVTVTETLIGDVNNDGKVSISDVTALIDLLLSENGGTNPAADINGDGRTTISDVTALIDRLLSDTGGTLKGDVDNNGAVNINDVTALIDYLLSGQQSINQANADLDNDGRITISDVTGLIDLLLRG